MRYPAPLPPTLNGAGFTVAQARAAGLGPGRLRSAGLHKPFHGVRSTAALISNPSRAVALFPRLTPNQYFSHTTAAELLGLRMPEGFRAAAVHVTSVRPHRAPRLRGVTGHESGPALLVAVDGLRVLNAVDTWVQLASALSIDDLVVMGDGLVRRKRPLSTMDQLRRAVESYRGRGVRKLRAAFALVRPGTDSARETTLRLVVVRAGYPEPEVNGVIHNSYGARIAHGDLVFRQYRTILEYEGRQHSEDDRQFAIDISRLDELMDEGWRVIRVDRDLMSRRATLIGKVERALVRGGWEPPSPT